MEPEEVKPEHEMSSEEDMKPEQEQAREDTQAPVPPAGPTAITGPDPAEPSPPDPAESTTSDPAESSPADATAMPEPRKTAVRKKTAASKQPTAATPRTRAKAASPATPIRAEAGDQTEAGDRTAAAAPGKQPTSTAGSTRTPRKAVPPKRPRARKSAAPKPALRTVAPESTPVRAPEAPTRTPEAAGQSITARLLDHPGFAPELLAVAAVHVLGPGARAWVQRTRAVYPAATPDGLARLATRRFVRLAGAGGAGSAAAGVFAPLAELAAISLTQVGLVLHLAAAYGLDPAHPDRAADLLVLMQVHPDDASARTALAAAGQAGPAGERPLPRVVEAAWRLAVPLAAQTGGWLALRLAARLMPGAAMLSAAAGDSAATERLAARALARYRPRRARQ